MREEMSSNDSDDMVVIPCVHHKTGTSGLVYLVIIEQIDDMIQYYYEPLFWMLAAKIISS